MIKKYFIICFLILSVNSAFACTTFTFSDKSGKRIFGRNLDFPVGFGHIELNYRNMLKTAFVFPPEKPISWESKYGSITFNQAGREFPYGGMNEAGLVIEQMWLQETKYPELDERYGLNELQWIQYQLDNSKNVHEVLDSDSLLRISVNMATTTLHFLISDAEGNAATIEYLNGKMVVHQGTDLSCSVLANDTYENSINYQNNILQEENSSERQWTSNSLDRFSNAARLIEQNQGNKNSIEYSFDILGQVAQKNSTQWSIVYDITDRKIHYKSSINPEIQKIDLNKIDFSCKNIPLFIDISKKMKDESSFAELTFEQNLNLIENIVNGVEFLKNSVPPEANQEMAKYAQSIVCKNE